VASNPGVCKPYTIFSVSSIEAKEYDEYLVPALFEPWARDLIRRAQVWKGDRVVDLACGTGIVACRIAGTGAQVVGIDASADQLAQAKVRAREENVPVTWLQRDFSATTLKSAAFDLVTCQQGFQFAIDRAAVVKETRRLLASGGRAVFACWAALAGQDGFREVEAVSARHYGPADGVASSMTEPELKALFAKHFIAVQVETATRIVRFPDPERFARSLLATKAAARGATPNDEAVAEALTALAPFLVGDQLQLQSAAIVAIGRVTAK